MVAEGLQDSLGNLKRGADKRELLTNGNILDVPVFGPHLLDEVVDQHSLVKSVLPAACNEQAGESALLVTYRSVAPSIIPSATDVLVLGNIKLVFVEVIQKSRNYDFGPFTVQQLFGDRQEVAALCIFIGEGGKPAENSRPLDPDDLTCFRDGFASDISL